MKYIETSLRVGDHEFYELTNFTNLCVDKL